MRLLFLNHNYRFFSNYMRAIQMAEVLVARGHKVTVMTVSREHSWRNTWSVVNGVRLAETPNWGQNNSGEGYGPLDNLLRCAHSLANRYDIIHMLDHKPNSTFAGFTGRVRGAKLVADWADWWGGPGGINDVPRRRIPAVGRFEEWWEVRSKLWADGVATISSVLYQRALDIGCAPDRVAHIPNGADVNLIKPIPTEKARDGLGVPADRKVVGFFGVGQGDLEIVMAALQQLPGVWLMVVGPLNARVLDQARSFGIEDRLWQTGFVAEAELSRYLACADLMCLPMVDRAANRGRLPGKIMYYMAAGRPTVASPVGDVADILRAHRVGIAARDDEFAAAIDRLLRDDALRAELGARARQLAETEYSWPPIIDRLEDFYSRILADRR